MKRVLFFSAILAAASALTVAAQNPAPSSAPKPARPAASSQPKSSAAAQAAAEAANAPGVTPEQAAVIQKRVEAFLRNEFAWGKGFEVKAGGLHAGPVPDLYAVPDNVTNNGQSDMAIVFVSKDGKYMIRGEVQDLETNPLAETRRQITVDGYASKGPSNAKVEIVEFGDFECPSCRQLEYILRAVLPKYPQVRYVFKDFPLDSIHPWASTAALAGHCVLKQGSDAFWKFHDSVYDDQDLISVENSTSKLAEIASKAGADLNAYQACMSDPKTVEIVKKSTQEGQKLEITGTPTTFINGRRLVGPDQTLLEQYIQFDLNPVH